MTEWGVVLVIAALVALLATLVAPVVKLTTSITRLSTLVDGLSGELAGMTAKNEKSHDRIWKKSEEQDSTLDDHEHRITVLEHK